MEPTSTSPTHCPGCGTTVEPGTKSCPSCGRLLWGPGQLTATTVCAIHPERPAFRRCESCQSYACDACLRVDDAGRRVCVRCEARDPRELLPWDRRDELGLPTAFFRTAVGAMLRPHEVFRRATPEGTLGSSALFAMCAAVPGYLPSALVNILFAVVTIGSVGTGASELLLMLGVHLLTALGAVIAAPLLLFVVSGIDHLVLRTFGAPGSYLATYRAASLSLGPMLVGLFPICGGYAFPLWILVSRVFAYRDLQRVSTGAAVAGALVSVALCCTLGAGVFGLAIWGMR